MRTARYVRHAPKTGKFVLLGHDASLPKGRRLVVSAPLTGTDGGNGGDYTVAVAGATTSARGAVKLAGQLAGAADLPEVTGIRVLDGGTGQLLSLNEVQDGEALVRSGSTLAGVAVVPAAGGTMTGNLAMSGSKVTGLASGSAPGDAATYGQLSSLLNGLDWQGSVLAAQAAPPGSPSTGSRYLVTATATGAWSGHEEKIAQWSGTGWDFTVPNKGFTVHVEALGQDLHYNDVHPTGAWVNIGASVDHAALLNLSTGDPHSQYQLGALREAANGYAGLGADNLPIRPSKGVRIGGDPGSPAPGEVWVVGSDLKFRNDTGSPATEIVERQARRNQPNGYPGLDGAGRVAAAQAPPKSVYAAGGDQALGPGDVGAVAASRSVATAAGLAGGGDLSANRTLSIAAFTGLISRDLDPAQASWSASETKVHATYDVGPDGMLIPIGLRLPATVSASLVTEVVFEFQDASTRVITNANTGATLDDSMQGLADALLGGVAGADQNNGKAVRKVIFQTRNTTGTAVSNVDIGVFRIRAYAFPRGAGSAL